MNIPGLDVQLYGMTKAEALQKGVCINCSGFKFYVKQNCATNEYHFNVIFSALTEKQVRELSKRLIPKE